MGICCESIRPFKAVMATSSCSECEYRTSRPSDLKKHILVHDKIRKYACGTCGLRSTTSSDARRHERTHTDNKSFICSFENCCYSTSRREHLTNHESTHASIESRLNHPCALCYKFFSSKSVLNRHIKTCGKGSSKESESKVDKCKCDICGKVLSSSFKLKQHAKLHSDSLDYSCGTCSKQFATREALRKHASLHDEKKFICHMCEKKFSRKDYLEKHMKVHEDSVDSIEYVCTGCNASYNSTTELQAHCAGCRNTSGGSEEDLVFIPNYSHEVVIAQVEAGGSQEEHSVEQDQVYYLII